MKARNSILICSEHPPRCDQDSGSQRLSDLIDLLFGAGWHVTFLATRGLGEVRYSRVLQQRGVAVFDGTRTCLEDLIANAQFAVALFSTWSVAAAYLPIVRCGSPKTRLVVDTVDLNFLRNARRCFQAIAAEESSAGLDNRFGNELVRELNVCASADAVLAVSQKEADLLADFIGRSETIYVLRDMEDRPVSRVQLGDRRGILFIGSFRHAPNAAALKFLCRELAPKFHPGLLTKHPIYVIGSDLNDDLRQLAVGLQGVQMIGWVPSVRPYLESARVSIVPLTYGAGTKRKLLQSLMAGTPAVSTSIGAEGFNLRDGKHLLVADDAALFAAATQRLLEDDLLWRQLSRQARAHLLPLHGRKATVQRLQDILDRVLMSPPKSANTEAMSTGRKPVRINLRDYQTMRTQIQSLVRNCLPGDAKIIVVSRGDEELLKLNGCAAWHFPQNAQGLYSGHHPGTSAEAIEGLETLRAKGGEFLLFPSTASWWLDHYEELRHHLQSKYREVVRQDGVCTIYQLTQAANAAPPLEVRAERPESLAGHGKILPERQIYLTSVDIARGKQAADYAPITQISHNSQAFPVKALAFYLPQFHAIPENDKWWGPGFTEWTNVSKAVPQFAGHYQPHLPGELGFYDLRVPEVQRRQVQLARQYGIHGFCFYYYWFAGKQLLERPLNQFMADSAIDFPFCICWANENWTRRWDGKDQEILIAQNHCEETDLAFVREVQHILQHKNYIRIHGRPVLLVYRVRLLPEPLKTAMRWREYCMQAGIGNPYLIAAEAFEPIDPRPIGFDAAVEFPPNIPGPRPDLTPNLPIANSAYAGMVHHYDDLVQLALNRESPAYKLFKTVCPGWDNEARRPGRGLTYAFSSPAAYARWLDQACQHALREPDPAQRFVFINAWNEWGEGAHLEPDRRFGYAFLQATANVLSSQRAGKENWTILFVSHDAQRGGAQAVLLSVMAWLKQHTSLTLKALCLEGGPWLSRFEELAETLILTDLGPSEQASNEESLARLRSLCGGSPHLVFGNSVASGRAYPLLAGLGAPILTHVHELETSIKRYAGRWMRDILKLSAHHIACSKPVHDNLVENHGISPTRISTVHECIPPVDTVHHLDEGHRKQLRQRLGLITDKSLAFGCGLGMPFRKGADLFIEVAQRLWRAGRRDIHFYWVGEFGRNESDPEYGPWADFLARLKQPDAQHVTFLGHRENAKEYLQAADVFLLTSREDPFPLVALEAAQAAVPILCFQNAGGMPDFVGEDAGVTVPWGDVAAMAHALEGLLAESKRKNHLGSNARQKVNSRFTSEFIGPHILSVCRRVASKKPAVSVIVPNYNHASYLPERLNSIVRQTYRDIEIILLDDASSDNSLEVLERYRSHADVRIVRNEHNSGSTFKQWLKGLEMARGDIIWIAESDDSCEPDFLEVLMPSFQDPRVKLTYANSQVMDENSKVIGDYAQGEYLVSLSQTKWAKEYRVSAEQEINDGLGVKNTILSASAVLFRRFELSESIRATLGQMRIVGDWYFWIKAILHGEIHYTARKLNYHRRHSESVIGKLLRQNRVGEFFREFAVVQSEIFARYHLAPEFAAKWERYLRDQWQSFFPGRPFVELQEYYPLEAARERIKAAFTTGTQQELRQRQPVPQRLPLVDHPSN